MNFPTFEDWCAENSDLVDEFIDTFSHPSGVSMRCWSVLERKERGRC